LKLNLLTDYKNKSVNIPDPKSKSVMAGYTPDVTAFPYFGGSENKTREIYDLYDFKNRAQESCGAHVVMSDLMDRVERSEKHEKYWRTCYADQKKIERKKDMEIKRLKNLCGKHETLLNDPRSEVSYCDHCECYKFNDDIAHWYGEGPRYQERDENCNNNDFDTICIECLGDHTDDTDEE
tara:strand:+ start:805 stop:1344 length:540 start_codon:yes stop_codon:yes gene_type:complete